MAVSQSQIRILLVTVILSPGLLWGQSWRDLYYKADSLFALRMPALMPEALELARVAAKKAEAHLGDIDTNVARTYNLLAALLIENSQPELALPYAERALAIEENLLGPDDISVARTLELLAQVKHESGKRKEENLLRARAVSIFERADATENEHYTETLHNLAYTYQAEGNFSKAAEMYARSLEIKRRIVGPGHPDLAYSLTMLATVYIRQGLFNEAGDLLKEALRNWENYYGAETGMAAICMGNLARLYGFQGKLRESEVLAKKALALAQTNFSSNRAFLGGWYRGLGMTLMEQLKYEEAIDTLRRAIAIWQSADKTETQIADATALIAQCHLERHDYKQAEADYLRVLAAVDSLPVSAQHLRGSVLLGLARTHMCTGRFTLVDSLLKASYNIREALVGGENPSVAEVLELWGDYYQLAGNSPEALRTSRRAVVIRKKNFLLNARMMPEHDALLFSMFLRQSLNKYLSRVIDAHAFSGPPGIHAADLIVATKAQTTEQTILRRKGLAAETDSATQALAEEYRYARFQLSKLYVEGSAKKPPEQFRREIDSLEATANDFEALLARRSASFAATRQDREVTVTQIASHLPRSSTLIEYLKFDYVHLNPDTLIPRYIAVVVDASGNSRIVDLGEAGPIDQAIEKYRSHFETLSGKPTVAREEATYNVLASQLYDLIWRPLQASLKGQGTVFIAPDGGLNLVSFAGLIDKNGKYLIEAHPLHSLSAGRDVLRSDDTTTSAAGFIAFGDPDFDATVAERISNAPQIAATVAADNPYQVRNVRSGCELLSEMTVSRLYSTRTEVESITGFWKERTRQERAEALLGAQASEERFKQESTGKRILHLATHGYFLQSGCMPATHGNTAVGENPLLQSGLLLAGANLHGAGAKEAGAEDGIVTALEVSAMDLRGTDLVVLSACETGLGKVEQGEGVYGLRRAFQMAGARTVVSSLWQVPDDETMKFMKTLYSTNAGTYPELMQQVALKRIREARLRGRPAHPLAWGAFIATGDWRIR